MSESQPNYSGPWRHVSSGRIVVMKTSKSGVLYPTAPQTGSLLFNPTVPEIFAAWVEDGEFVRISDDDVERETA